jgi:hypothetical protein
VISCPSLKATQHLLRSACFGRRRTGVLRLDLAVGQTKVKSCPSLYATQHLLRSACFGCRVTGILRNSLAVATLFHSLLDLHIQAYSLRRRGATRFFRHCGSLDRTVLRSRWLSAESSSPCASASTPVVSKPCRCLPSASTPAVREPAAYVENLWQKGDSKADASFTLACHGKTDLLV